MERNSPLLSFREKVAYGFGDLASVLYWQTFMLYLTYFYTDVFIIPAAAAATMFLVTRLFDGINDPIMGMIADRTQTRWGKFRPYLLWLAVPFAISGVLVFTTPNFGESGKIIWAYSTFILIMILYTAINIPYTALMGVISPNSQDRTSVSSMKFIFAFAAGIIISATLLPMTKALGGGSEQQGWQSAFIIYGIAAVIFFLIAFKGTKERVAPPTNQKMSVKKDLFELVTNRPWLILLATTLTFILFVAIRGSVTAHYFKYYIDVQTLKLPFLSEQTYSFEALVSAYNTIGQISSLLGVIVVLWVSKVLGKKKTFILFFIIAIISTGALYFLTAKQLGLIYFLQITGSMTGGPLSVLLWAMYADTADYGEWKRGRRATGLVFSASTMSQKFGWAIGAFITLNLMAGVGFQPNEIQSPESMRGLLLLFSVIPAAIGILSLIIYLTYPLSDEKVKHMTTELEARRAAEGTQTETV
jgi:glycoside/pentoside/hexuronide:cation symporter, GPH family